MNKRDIERELGIQLLEACELGKTNKIKALLKKGANPNITDDIGMTPLMKACYWLNPKIVKILLENGADVNAQDDNGISALMRVCDEGIYRCRNHTDERISLLTIEIISILLEFKADINLEKKKGFTVLNLVPITIGMRIRQLLIENGALLKRSI